MLNDHEFMLLMDELATPGKGRQLIAKVRNEAPVRDVKSTGKNIITFVASQKMARSIATESRTVEYAAVMQHETDPQVLEYYMQPCLLKLELIDESTGEVHAVDHYPDILVIKQDRVILQEWKTENRLLSLARNYPWRYVREDDAWRSPQIEKYLAQFGIIYELRSGAEIHPNRTKNLELLHDYLHDEAPDCSPKMLQRLKEALAEHGYLSLGDLHDEPFKFLPDEINLAVAQGHVACDLDAALLSNPHDFLVYRDNTLMEYHQAGYLETYRTADPSFALDLVEGAKFRYEGDILTLTMLGEQKLVFTVGNESVGKTITLTKEWVLGSISSGDITPLNDVADTGMDLQPINRYSEDALQQAIHRTRILQSPFDPFTSRVSRRSYYRYQASAQQAAVHGGNEVAALIPRHQDKGNRRSRLTPEQIAAMEHIRKKEHVSTRAPIASNTHRLLQAYCHEHNITCPSYPTFLAYLKDHDSDAVRRIRYGKRGAYQVEDFHYTLAYDTPRHGVRPFETVHVDHTLLDIEIQCHRTQKPLGRPWLTMFVDSFSRRIMAIYLTFSPPDRTAVLLGLRAFVKRWNRLPQILICDNGKDLISRDVQNFLTSMNVHHRLRPAAQPRVGSVIERLFGTLNTQLLHNLDGNTELTKNVRALSGSHLPQRLANWSLGNLYAVIEHWAFTYYDRQEHPALQMSPKAAFDLGLANTGARPHRAIVFNRDFLIATCPSPDRGGMRKVDRQRGVKVNNFYYQSPVFDSMGVAGKRLPVRYDPHDVSRVFVQLPDRQWVEARSMQLQHLPRMNIRQLEAISTEYLASRKGQGARKDSIPDTRLLEFIATLSPDSPALADAQKLGETEFLHSKLGLLDETNDARPKVFGIESLQTYATNHSSGRSLVGAQDNHNIMNCRTTAAPSQTKRDAPQTRWGDLEPLDGEIE